MFELSVPPGNFSGRLDLELFAAATTFLLTSVIPVSFNDIYLRKDFRTLEYIRSWPFHWSRVLSAWFLLLVFAFVIFALLRGYSDVASTTVFLLVFLALGPLIWQVVYGYLSQIMMFVGRSLLAITILALYMNLLLHIDVPPAARTVIGWSALFAGPFLAGLFVWTHNEIQQQDDKDVLLKKQRPYHHAYLFILFLGHVVIYVTWIIYPLVANGWLTESALF